MSIQVIKAGILDTIQDLGRCGYQHMGINPGGAMDRYALQVANALVGNQPGEAAIEIHFPASVFHFTNPTLIAVSGADFSASINGEPVPHEHPILVSKNDVLQFQRPITGARAYLAIAGGMKVAEWLGSKSTHLKAGIGGYKGRQFQKGDEIFFHHTIRFVSIRKYKILPWKADMYWGDDTKEILVLRGNEWERLSSGSKENFVNTSFKITQQSDRMGYRLSNLPITVTTKEELISSAVNFGTIQLLPDGNLIVLVADHQTTGGYPRVGHIISAHHSRVAQLKAGDTMHFQLTDQMMAEKLWLDQQQHLLQLQNACTFRLEEYFHAG
jgi:antagonist of KipI